MISESTVPQASPIPHPNTGKPFLCGNHRIRTRELQAPATGLARSCGILLFLSLSFSLVTAFAAILAKQWSRIYLEAIPGAQPGMDTGISL